MPSSDDTKDASTSGMMMNEMISQVELNEREAERPPSFDASAVGERLHQMRKERKLTLQETALLTGVSASAFSKIERGELSPTIGTMQRISDGLGLDVVALLSGQSSSPQAYGRRSINRMTEGRAHTTSTCENRLLSGDLRDKRMLPIITRVTARSTDAYKEWARSNSEVFVYVISGALTIHSKAYEALTLQTGESIYYDANIDHAWTTASEEPAEVLWIISAR